MSVAVSLSTRDDKYKLATWAALVEAETGTAVNLGAIVGLKTVQVTGTFGGGATVSIEGSMDGTTWFVLRSADYTAGDYTLLSGIAANMLSAIVENPLFVRPVVVGGAGATIKVVIGGNSLV